METSEQWTSVRPPYAVTDAFAVSKLLGEPILEGLVCYQTITEGVETMPGVGQTMTQTFKPQTDEDRRWLSIRDMRRGMERHPFASVEAIH